MHMLYIEMYIYIYKTFPAYLTPLSWRFSTASYCVKSIGGETTYMVSHPAAAAPLERLSSADQTVWNHRFSLGTERVD